MLVRGLGTHEGKRPEDGEGLEEVGLGRGRGAAFGLDPGGRRRMEEGPPPHPHPLAGRARSA